jgi:uncharacterized protein YecT (DUF1311 family)
MPLVAIFKQILFLLFLYFGSLAAAQNQAELNAEALKSYKKADMELNKIYQQIQKEYISDTVFLKNLKASQRTWITFRDAELKMKYPETDPTAYGTSHSMCLSIYMEKLTKERIKTLKVWLEGVKEGDICAGSVKVI